VRGTAGKVTGVRANVANQVGSNAAQIQSGLEALNISSGLYVTAADFERRVVDEGYDLPSSPETPDVELLARLEAAGDQHRTPAPQLLQDSRCDSNESPMSRRNQQLRLVTPRSPSPTATPAPLSVQSQSNSDLYDDPQR
jgi:hypothetical protein